MHVFFVTHPPLFVQLTTSCTLWPVPKEAQNSSQHLDFDGSLQPLFIT